MTRIGLISDTHSYIHPSLFEAFSKCDEIWHAGDIGNIDTADRLSAFKPLKAVYGNIDDYKVREVYPEVQVLHCEELKICICHIAGYPGRYSTKAKNIILKESPDIFVAGHSHILKVIYDKKYKHLHLNPGAAGKSGLHNKITMLRFTIDGKDIKEMEIIEYNRVSSDPVD